MFWPAFIWFVALACIQAAGRPDAPFSAVRRLNVRQLPDGTGALTTGFKAARSSRPLFSWDFIPPASENLESTSSSSLTAGTTSLLPTPYSWTHKQEQLSVPHGHQKIKHRKNRNRRKHFSRSNLSPNFTNQSRSDLNKQEFQGTGGDGLHQSFRLTKERKHRNRNRKDRTGRRKPKAERRKEDGNKKKRKDRKKPRRKGKKFKQQGLSNNSVQALPNEGFNQIKPSNTFEISNSPFPSKHNLYENNINPNDHSSRDNIISPLSTTDNQINLQTIKNVITNAGVLNETLTNSILIKKEDTNSIADNNLPPLIHTSIIGSEINYGREQNNITDNRNELPLTRQEANLFNHTTEENKTASGIFDLLNKETHLLLEKEANRSLIPDEENNIHVLLGKNENELSDLNSTTGDLSCLAGTFLPAPAVPNSAIKYIRTQSRAPPHSSKYLLAEYECLPHHHLKEPGIHQLYCSQRKWLGEQPSCIPDKVAVERQQCADRGSCDHICEVVAGVRQCSCYKGFHMDGGICRDMNECAHSNGGCESGCHNTPGSHHCLCPVGLRLADNGRNCVDINECLLRNGHGPCQDTCLNLWGSYECSCKGIPGTKLAADNHTCQDVDECADGSAGCSHTCLNTLGSAFCLCPTGFMLGDDWKTCQDIDECSYEELQNEKCELGCVNTVGSYHCLEPQDESSATEPVEACPAGFRVRPDGSCEDVDECKEKTSGCAQGCLNIRGSFQCYCGLGFALASDNKTCIDGAEEAVCPPLESPAHGYLECARHLVRTKKSKFPWMKRARVVNHAGAICQLICPYGYVLEGEFRKTCGQNRQWTGPDNGTCLPLPAPNIKCPNNMTVHMQSTQRTVLVNIKQPTTNVNWFRYVESVPGWGKQLSKHLSPGHWEIKFTATHPMSHLTASCTVGITVLTDI